LAAAVQPQQQEIQRLQQQVATTVGSAKYHTFYWHKDVSGFFNNYI